MRISRGRPPPPGDAKDRQPGHGHFAVPDTSPNRRDVVRLLSNFQL
jgi:hypothetical protein